MAAPLTALAPAALRLALLAAVHLPPWALSPDGEVVAVEGARLEAEGAEVEPLGAGLWRVRPAPGARTVRLRAGEAAVEARVEPPPGRIAIEATPAQPVKGRDATVRLALVVLDGSGKPDAGAGAPVVIASVGAVRDLVPAGPGRFAARYEPPASRPPELGVLVALVTRCPLCPTPRAAGTAVLPLAAAIDLPGHTDPNVRVAVRIGARTFGPVVADAGGDFRVPVVVPPGERLAEGESVDALGNRRLEAIDLHLPPVGRLACAAWPAALPADGRSQAGIWCVATDEGGRPERRAGLEISAARGRAGPFEAAGPATFRARYTAPLGAGGGSDQLVVTGSAGGTGSVQRLAIALGTGAPADLGYELAREPVPLGAEVEATTWARDAAGAALLAPRGPAGAAEGFVSAHRFRARATAGDWVQPAELQVELPPEREVASLHLARDGVLWVAAARGVSGGPVPGAEVEFGSGVRAVTDARGEARAPASGPSETARTANGARAAAWEGFGSGPPPVALSRTFAVPLAPQASVDVRARLEGRILRWRVVDPEGRALPGRAVRLEPSGVRLGPAEEDGEGGRCRVEGAGTVAVVDAETGVAAVVEVR